MVKLFSCPWLNLLNKSIPNRTTSFKKCNVDILLRPTHQKRNARDLWPDCLCIVNADILRLSAQRHRWEGGLPAARHCPTPGRRCPGSPLFLLSQTVTVELKNDLQVKGTLMSVDQYLNIKLDNTSVLNKLAEIAANLLVIVPPLAHR
jgi:hypothetical protein